MFECDAWGCHTEVKVKDGLCKDHLRRYLDSKRPGAPAFLRKKDMGGTGVGTPSVKKQDKKKPLTPPSPDPSPLGVGSPGEERKGKGKEKKEMNCSRCNKSSEVDKRFNCTKGLCNACQVTIAYHKKAGTNCLR